MRRFEKSSDNNSKFWIIKVEQNKLITTYGRLGTSGRVWEKQFNTEQEARVELERRVSEKVRKGYQEVFVEEPAEDVYSENQPIELLPLPSLLSDFFCPGLSCKSLGPGSLYLVEGTESNPTLRCSRCSSKENWQTILRQNMNIQGQIEAGMLMIVFLSILYFLPVHMAVRLLLALLPIYFLLEFSYKTIRYIQRVKTIQTELLSL